MSGIVSTSITEIKQPFQNNMDAKVNCFAIWETLFERQPAELDYF